MTATIQFTMEFEPKHGVLHLDEFLSDLDGSLMHRYNGNDKFFADQIVINSRTRVIKLIADDPMGSGFATA